jgi:hypothetical protein
VPEDIKMPYKILTILRLSMLTSWVYLQRLNNRYSCGNQSYLSTVLPNHSGIQSGFVLIFF